jgi:hypothetical protein
VSADDFVCDHHAARRERRRPHPTEPTREPPERPRSVPAATVFRRCAAVVEDFTDGDVNGAVGLIELRDEELHSGGRRTRD